jgi:hypothetical protein
MLALTELPALDSEHQVDIEPLYADAERQGLQERTVDNDLAQLKSIGWINYWESLQGIGTVMVEQPGFDAAQEFTAMRSSKVRRNRACRDDYLHWLYDSDTIGNFLDTRSFLGTPYTEQELKDAKNWLKGEGFLTGPATADDDIYYPQITSEGIKVVESGESVNSWSTKGISVNDNSINIHGSSQVNVAQGSKNVKQSNTLTQEQSNKIAEVIESYRALSTALNLPQEQLQEAEGIVGEIESVAGDAGAEPGKIRQGFERLAGIISEYGAKGVATAVLSVIGDAVQMLG